jgi:4-hydroxy-2-oxoheptanedioate aldolase
MGHPAVVEARRRIADAARRHGKFAGTVGSLDNLQSLVDLGYQFVNLTADVTTLASTFYGVAQKFSQWQQK